MRLLITALCLSVPVGAVAQTPGPAPCLTTEANSAEVPWDLEFVADPGIRVDYAALPKPFVDEHGRVHLFYQESKGPGSRNYYAISSDGLTFEDAREEQATDLAYHPFRVRMPNGVWRMYSWDQRTGELRSRSAGDGAAFADDPGVRYRWQPEDNQWSGVHDEYVDRDGRVVLLYLGDNLGLNNLRRAISTDNGWTFTFTNGNVLGDSDDARERGPSAAFVDQKTIALPDGLHRLFAMRQGCAIYSFIEGEDGAYTRESGMRVTVESWPDLSIRSLHDPVVVRLADGRYRMYVCASLQVTAGEPLHEVIVTATTKAPPGIQ